MSAVLTGRSRAALAVVMSVLVVFSGGGGAAFAAVPAYTYTVGPPIAVEGGAFGAAVDPGTHSIYVTNVYGASVSVIDGLTKTVTTTIGVGSYPYGVAVDPVTHTVYVTNYGDDTVSVINSVSKTVTATVAVGNSPGGVAVDTDTHTAYVTSDDGGTVSVIDGASSTVTDTVTVNVRLLGVAVDPGTHTAYVAGFTSSTVSVITQSSLQGQTISFTSAAPSNPVQGGTYTVSATGGGSGNPVTFTIDASSTPGACTVTNQPSSTGTVAFTGVGTCVVNADQAAGASYAAAPRVQQTLTVGPAAPSTVTATSGSAQTAPSMQPFPARLVATVTDQYANPVPGAKVTFTVTSRSATFRTRYAVTVTTTSSGAATSPVLTAGRTAGPVTVTATSGPGSATFTETVTCTGSNVRSCR